MPIQIVYNKAVEFLNGISKYSGIMDETEWRTAQGPHIDKTGLIYKDLLDFTPSKYVKEWIDSIENTISAFMKNDMNLLFNELGMILNLLHIFIIDEAIETPEELIASLKRLTLDDITQAFYDHVEIPLDMRDNPEAIKVLLTETMDLNTATIIAQFQRHPTEFIDKLINIFEYFLAIHFKPIEAELDAFLLPKLAQHRILMASNPLHFLNIIGIGDYKTYVDSDYPITLYISAVTDVGMAYFTHDNTLFMIYGINMEKRFDQLVMKEKCKNLFKALSDEKRLEIIKLTSIRPYYNKELADHFGLTSATLSYHINLLLDIGILNFEPRPNNRYYYTTNKEALKTVFNMSLDMLLE
jgi:DNA-binding transcriptional ArsR family regulator